MIYIVEGLNKVGKTTFIQEISNKYNISCVKFRRPNSREEAKIVPYIILELLSVITFPSFMIDRFYPSELVYNKRVNEEYFMFIDSKLSQYAKIWYLNIPSKILRERWNEFNISFDMKYQLEMYEDFLSKTKLSVVRINPLEEIKFEDII